MVSFRLERYINNSEASRIGHQLTVSAEWMIFVHLNRCISWLFVVGRTYLADELLVTSSTSICWHGLLIQSQYFHSITSQKYSTDWNLWFILSE